MLQSLFTSRKTPQPTDNLETKRGIDTRLLAALSRLRTAQAAYDAAPGGRNLDELLAAETALQQVRSAAMDAAVEAAFSEAKAAYGGQS